MSQLTRRKIDFVDFEAIVTDVDTLLARGYDRCGKWSLAENCEHLATFMDASTSTGFTTQPPFYIRLLRPLIKLYFFRTRSLPEGQPAPPEIRPTSANDDAAGVAHLKRAIDAVRSCTRFQPSPFLGDMPPEEWRQLHLIHCSHHLSFLVPRASAGGQ